MIIDMDQLAELRKIFPYCAGLRVNKGNVEFALETIFNVLEWFPYWRMPEHAQKWIEAHRMIL